MVGGAKCFAIVSVRPWDELQEVRESVACSLNSAKWLTAAESFLDAESALQMSGAESEPSAHWRERYGRHVSFRTISWNHEWWWIIMEWIMYMISQERDDWQNTYGSSAVCPKFGEKELQDGSDSSNLCVVDVSWGLDNWPFRLWLN